MGRTAHLSTMVLLILTSRVAFAQDTSEMSKVWKLFAVEADKMTDKKTLTATAVVSVPQNDTHQYQFEMKCDGALQSVTISAYDNGRPRSIEWDVLVSVTGGPSFRLNTDGSFRNNSTPVVGAESATKPFRYRIDSAPAESGSLVQRYTNGGEAKAMFQSRLIERHDDSLKGLTTSQAIARIGDADRGVQSSVGNSRRLFYDAKHLSYPDVSRTVVLDNEVVTDVIVTSEAAPSLPTTRIIVADLFPDEVAEIPFNVLTPISRTTIQTMCFATSR